MVSGRYYNGVDKLAFIKADLKDVKEAAAVPEGEYALRILKVEEGESKKGNQMLTLTIKIEDSGIKNPAPMRHWIVLPDSSTPDDQVQMRNLELKRLLAAFGIKEDGEGFDTDDLTGATGRGFVAQEEGDDGSVYNRLRLPRLKE
jgi:hypothetical protein